jgi:hypothetical protein
MDAAGISAATLARLFGISPASLSNAFRDIGYLGSEREAELLTLSLRIVELQEALRPLREPTNVDDLRQLLDHAEVNGISPDKVRETVSSLFGVKQHQ